MESDRNERTAVVPLLVFSVVFLALEILLTRILAYSVHTILLYTVLGIAMLGTGAAGSLVAVRYDWVDRERIAGSLAWAATVASLSVPLCLAAFVRCTPYLGPTNPSAFLIATLLTFPFLCAGVVITLALTSAGPEIGRCYAANLIGSGLGCFLPVLLLGPLDGEQMLGLLSALSWVAALLYAARVPTEARGRLRGALAVSLVVAAVSMLAPYRVFPVQPDLSDQIGDVERWTAARGILTEEVFDRWNGTGRVQVLRFQIPGHENPYPFMFYAQDSGAGSMLARWDGLDRSVDLPSARHRGSNIARACTQWLYGQGYSRHRSKVLVIGLGGGPDLQCALYHRARSVDAVEINPDSIRVVSETFSDWLGGVGDDDRVRFHNRDGRSFAHSSRGEGYDLIQMTGADTKHALASGGLAISENHLYTREAFIDYLESLGRDGVLSIVRFGEIDAFRLANTASAALRELGADAPHRHMAVFAHGDLSGVLVRRTPFPPGELAALERHLQPPYQGGLRIFFYEVFDLHQQPARVLYLPERRQGDDDERFAAFFAQMAEGSTAPFADAYAFDISPTDDDRPFFFDVDLYDETVLWSGAPHVIAIRNLLIATFALSIALILLPLRRMRERLHGRHAAAVPVYFASVGLAYMLVEVWMIHRFSMFLGHQTYGLSVVLASLLVGTGIGAHVGHGVLADAPQRRARLGAGAILLLLAVGFFALPLALETAWNASLPLRALTVMAFTLPTGFAMGLPFPAGLAWLARHRPGSMAWCVGINGFASVIATIIVIPLSLALGYAAVLASGAALYAIAASMTVAMDERVGG